MQKAFGNECMSKTRIKEWYNRFKGGRTSVDSDSRSGRPSMTKTLDIGSSINCSLTRKWSRNTENYCLGNFEQDFRKDSCVCGDWLLHHNNAPAHSSNLVQQFLSKDSIALLRQPLYSPDIAPCDFWLFPKLKKSLKGQRFDDKTTVENNATSVLKAIPKSEFQDCFEKWKRRLNRVIQSSGDYLKGCHPPDDEE